MALKMQAAVVEQFGVPLAFEEWDVPTPGPGQVLIKTEACGVSHTDIHVGRGDWPVRPVLPLIPGHEGVGLIADIGTGVKHVREGDRVGVPLLYSACGHCEYCVTGWEIECSHALFTGYTRNGGFAEYILADANYIAQIPSGVAAIDAAPIICAGVTAYKGIKQTEAKPGQWIVISGIGGLGHLAIQYAKAMGLHVCAIDTDNNKLAHAKRVGADMVINAKEDDAIATVQKQTDGGAHGVLITAPSLRAYTQGVRMTRKRGTCVLIGLPPGEFLVPLFNMVANCITIRGSFIGTRQDVAEALVFAADGKVKADIELQPLQEVNRVLDRLGQGNVMSCAVLDFAQ
jgi:propanol-preferring alcohol dehydrogenase